MLEGAIAAIAVLVAAGAAGLALGRGRGRVRAAARGAKGRRQLTSAQVGQALGERVTLLQFSSSFCAPCRAARQLLSDLAARGGGVTHIDLNVADRLDLVRLLDVRRTPTIFILGPGGQVSSRVSGVPRREDMLAAVAQAAGEHASGGRAPGPGDRR